MTSKITLSELLAYPHETEWLEFKTNYWQPDEIGTYISALSNSAAMHGRKTAYMVWGVDDTNHQVVGTTIDFLQDYKKEPYEHYLARNLSPSIHFKFKEITFENKRIVILEIPAAINVPTEYCRERYIRIGSSKENLHKYPQREAALWASLSHGLPSLTNTDSERQELNFSKLFLYYATKNKTIKPNSFKKNLRLLNEETGKYNLLALLLSDENAISARVSLFNGENKSSGLKSVREFGNSCILYALEAIANYGKDVLNTTITDERNRVLERKDKYLFDNDAFREALINAFVHNNWQFLNSPQISVYSDRIEILSHGVIGPDQTFEGFFNGESKPVNPALAHVFMQLEISDRSGKGVPTIVDKYGKNSFIFGNDSITVVIPFANYSSANTDIKGKIIDLLRDEPNLTSQKIAKKLNISNPMTNKHIRKLKEQGRLKRVGSNKTGHWQVL